VLSFSSTPFSSLPLFTTHFFAFHVPVAKFNVFFSFPKALAPPQLFSVVHPQFPKLCSMAFLSRGHPSFFFPLQASRRTEMFFNPNRSLPLPGGVLLPLLRRFCPTLLFLRLLSEVVSLSLSYSSAERFFSGQGETESGVLLSFRSLETILEPPPFSRFPPYSDFFSDEGRNLSLVDKLSFLAARIFPAIFQILFLFPVHPFFRQSPLRAMFLSTHPKRKKTFSSSPPFLAFLPSCSFLPLPLPFPRYTDLARCPSR